MTHDTSCSVPAKFQRLVSLYRVGVEEGRPVFRVIISSPSDGEVIDAVIDAGAADIIEQTLHAGLQKVG